MVDRETALDSTEVVGGGQGHSSGFYEGRETYRETAVDSTEVGEVGRWTWTQDRILRRWERWGGGHGDRTGF